MVGASPVPNTLRIDPGAKPGLKLAPLLTLVTAGASAEPDPDAVTLTVPAALLVPLYVAVMFPLPTGNCKPFTASVAVAVPADPVNAAVPNEAPEIEKDTEPDGTLPFVDVTVAIRYTTSFEATVLRLLSSVTLVTGLEGAVTLPPFHPITSLYASTDPSPVH